MPINNPAGEEHREQLKMYAEDLQREHSELVAELNRVFGSGNFDVDQEGNVSCRESDLELGEAKARLKAEAEKKLHDVIEKMNEIRKSDPDAWRETIH